MAKKVLVGLIIVAVAVGAWFFYVRETAEPIELTPVDTSVRDQEPVEPVDKSPTYNAEKIQTVIDDWVSRQSGEMSVVVMDPNNQLESLGAYQPDKEYFAASLYKLFVVYEGYKAIDDGTYNADELYLNGNTRAECLDIAIRSSDSPCAEAWWNELGKAELTEAMRALGITNTSLEGISTTARDSALLMSYVWVGEELEEQSRAAYLSSLLQQEELYRRGLPSGFSEEVDVYNKVGWNLVREWHDVAAVDFGDDRVLVVAVLTENVGMNNVATLATSLEAALSEIVE